VLAARGFTLSTAHEAHIDRCEDVAALDAWIVLGTTASALDVVFATPPR
jgi:hypothetical protein